MHLTHRTRVMPPQLVMLHIAAPRTALANLAAGVRPPRPIPGTARRNMRTPTTRRCGCGCVRAAGLVPRTGMGAGHGGGFGEVVAQDLAAAVTQSGAQALRVTLDAARAGRYRYPHGCSVCVVVCRGRG